MNFQFIITWTLKLYHKIHSNRKVCGFGPPTVNSVLLKILPAGPNVQHDTEQFDDHLTRDVTTV